MKLIVSSIFAFALLLVSCGTTKTTTESTKETSEFNNIAPGDSLFASIYRSPCYGTCPNYSLSIYNSGYAVYEGKRNAPMSGVFVTQFTNSEMKQLLTIAEKINYNELENEYDNKNVTDLPSTTTSLVMNGVRKEVRCRINCPATLTTFQNAFEPFIKDKVWIAQDLK